MTMHKTLYPRDDVDRLTICQENKDANIEDGVDASIKLVEEDIKKAPKKTDDSDKK